MKSNTSPIQTDTYYHIYNRGINGENLFLTSDNHFYFLKKYSHYISTVAETYAYCLLKNHFHLLVKTKSESEIVKAIQHKEKNTAEEIISRQFSNLFNGYTQAFNKANERTGALFDSPFRRIEITEDSYFSQLIFYIHYNPQKHGLCNNFKNWTYSSYQAYISFGSTKLKREEGLNWFGGKQQFVCFHDMQMAEAKYNKAFEIEFD